MPTGDAAETFSETPNANGPEHGSADGHLGCPAKEESESQGQLHSGEQAVERHWVMSDQLGIPMHRIGDEERLAATDRSDDVASETLGEHVRLKLQGPIEQPKKGHGVAKPASGHYGMSNSGVGPDDHLGVARREPLIGRLDGHACSIPWLSSLYG
jgi:hypothetical protein